MVASYSDSLAPGTVANKRRQAKDYLTFALQYGVNYLSPSITHVCMYAQRLANTHAAPSSIKNYLSGAKSWVEEHQGNIEAFLSTQVAKLVKGFVKSSTHSPSRAVPLASHHIQAICRFLDERPSVSLAIKPAILIGFSCFLRSSNLLSPTMTQWGGPHTLLAGDVSLSSAGLRVLIRSTKTRTRREGVIFHIPTSGDHNFCPVIAWQRYASLLNPWPLGPAFIHANRLPVTSGQVVAMMRLALENAQDIQADKISMHSLRRGAVHTAAEKGIPLQEIRARGTWKTASGMRPYLPQSLRSVTVPVSNLAE